MPLPFRAPILSYEKVNERAQEFLEKHGIGGKLPVPIDEVIEFEYGIDIVPFPNLQRDFDIEGFMEEASGHFLSQGAIGGKPEFNSPPHLTSFT
jgi:hypothetical protein